MANGDLITLDYQFQLHNTLYGRGSGGLDLDMTDTNGVQGLGVPDARTQDVPLFSQDGSHPNPDYLDVRVITVPAIMRFSGNESGLTSAYRALYTAWLPVTTSTDFAMQLPGWGKFYMAGRPRGFKADVTKMKYGIIRVLLRFDCPQPAFTFV